MNLDEARRKVLGWDKPVDKAEGFIRSCNSCERQFGTIAGYRAHWGERGCKASGNLTRQGMWQGHDGIWWTKDLGHDDTKQGWLDCQPSKVPSDEAFLRMVRNSDFRKPRKS